MNFWYQLRTYTAPFPVDSIQVHKMKMNKKENRSKHRENSKNQLQNNKTKCVFSSDVNGLKLVFLIEMAGRSMPPRFFCTRVSSEIPTFCEGSMTKTVILTSTNQRNIQQIGGLSSSGSVVIQYIESSFNWSNSFALCGRFNGDYHVTTTSSCVSSSRRQLLVWCWERWCAPLKCPQ